MTQPTDCRAWLFVGLIGIVGAAGCQDKSAQASGDEKAETESVSAGSEASESAPAESASGSGEASADEGEEGASAGESAPPAELYPEMNFGKLDPDQRSTFVSVAKTELCPCPDAEDSLHACLQRGGPCGAAKRMASLVARGVERGRGLVDIRDKLAEFAEQIEKEHDFDLESAPRRGPEDAGVTIVEFADFECPHCKRMSGVMEKIHETFGNDVAHYFKHFPLSAHEHAEMAARAATAAGKQGKFWPMHDLLFDHQRDLDRETVLRLARQIGLNVEKFRTDLRSREVVRAVQSNRKEGAKAGVSGTPTVFINGRRYVGPEKFKPIAEAVRARLESSNAGSGASDGGGGEGGE